MISDNLNAFPAGLACWAPTPAGSARANAIAATSGSHLQHARITPPALRARPSTASAPLLLLSGDGSDPHGSSSSSSCTTAALGAAPDPIVVGGPVPPRASRGGGSAGAIKISDEATSTSINNRTDKPNAALHRAVGPLWGLNAGLARGRGRLRQMRNGRARRLSWHSSPSPNHSSTAGAANCAGASQTL